MADCDTSASGGVVLTYNITNERGWNDPPSSVFSPSSGNRKRIDPRRKRVGHDFNNPGLTNPQRPINGTASPLPPMPHAMQPSNPPNLYQQPPPPQPSNLRQTFENMNLNPGGSVIHHSTSNPDLPQMATYNQPPPPQMHHAASVPVSMNTQGLATSGMNTPPLTPNGYVSGSQTVPYYQHVNDAPMGGSRTPPLQQTHENQERKLSVPTAPSSNVQTSIFRNMVTPTMLNSSHLQTNFNAQNDEGYSNPPLSAINNINLKKGVISNEPKMSSLPPMPVANTLNTQNMYNRSNSIPLAPPLQRVSPTNAFMGPPPTTGFYKNSSTDNSPRSSSPGNSGKNSPIPIASERIENESELLENTVFNLNNCRDKCCCLLPNKVSDDISKRIQAFENSWKQNKLSNNVKSRMGQLAEALTKSEFGLADSIHRTLACDHSNEVMPWMVGIKKLIATYQQAVLDNNKY